ncbi:hypothetical protein OIO90_003050 [Microbotryomycetes sp. JL221]|nr:hypothetical protein OIO90_003050 [Microbotryomycetes sp. JL221]
MYNPVSVMAPVGRWQANKDVTWYNKESATDEDKRREEIRKVKQAEEDALAMALGFAPAQRPSDNSDDVVGAKAEQSRSREDKELRRKAKEERRSERAERRAERESRRGYREREQERDWRSGSKRRDSDSAKRRGKDDDRRQVDEEEEKFTRRERPFERARRRSRSPS